MSISLLTGKTARGAALRGLLLGLMFQALLVGAIEIAGHPVRSEVAGPSRPAFTDAGDVGALAQARP
jgi:hypothetical protein